MAHDRFVALLDSVAGREDVRITFDDGNASDVEQALRRWSIAAWTRPSSSSPAGSASRTFLDADGVRELAAAGMGIGCHGMRHRPWRGLGETELREEHVEAKAMLEQIVERPVIEAACPFGSYDRRVLRIPARLGLPPRLHQRPRHDRLRRLPPGAQHASAPTTGPSCWPRSRRSTAPAHGVPGARSWR